MNHRKILQYARILCVVSILALLPCPARSAKLVLKNGAELNGKPGAISGIAEDPANPGVVRGPVPLSPIMLIDNELTRTFVSKKQVLAFEESPPIVPEVIKIWQPISKSQSHVAGIGSLGKMTRWDEFGRRRLSLSTLSGNIEIIQGITEITPTWTRVESLVGSTKHLAWDMRMATSSIPHATLNKTLMNNIDPKDINDRLSIFRLYLQAERYHDALRELEQLLKDFPGTTTLHAEAKALRQLSARHLLNEIELRSEAGQHELARGMLRAFPDTGVAAQLLIKVQEQFNHYTTREEQLALTVEQFDAQFMLLKTPSQQTAIAPIRREIGRELSNANFDHMADFRRLVDDDKLLPEQKLALAISGWLVGNGNGTQNLAVALSLYEARNLTKTYISSNDRGERARILEALQTMEGGTPAYLAKLLAHMTPPQATEWQVENLPGYFKLEVPGLRGDIEYHIQLPPEYDPHQHYPTIVTLGGIGAGPERQIDWWAGAYNQRMGMRLGQGARRGYIVISPKWLKPHQRKYEYSAREHAAVLYSLRDACRRFSIDTDRVFLTGHSIGGDAVWDIGLAHPDLWAGVLPIVPVADKYVARYWENAEYVSFYFVMGELDGNKLATNRRDFDRYLKSPNFDTMIVEYRGRGHEQFEDEIQRMFAWMDLHRRDFFPKEFATKTLRRWDNFFWWVELGDFPTHLVVTPARYEELNKKIRGPVQAVAFSRPATEKTLQVINVQTAAEKVTLWLSPEIVDFEKPLRVSIKRKSKTITIEPSTNTLLEDVRTRADRQHPFWAKREF